MPPKRHLPSRTNTATGQLHRRKRPISGRPPPNPSVKGTSTSGLRPLAAAPYVER